MPQFALGEEIGWTTLHRGIDGREWGILIELQGPITAIGYDPESGRILDYRIEATIGGRAVGSVRVPAAEASEVAVEQLCVWCAEFT
ncbi:hypothetical protein ACIO52_02955 [Nocardia sp. NPDC087230]|uniref:hypothetical protein n=1 Tax=Nocardia sp. NPDC087230 TaxID=3364331 RepID=UPI003814C2CD